MTSDTTRNVLLCCLVLQFAVLNWNLSGITTVHRNLEATVRSYPRPTVRVYEDIGGFRLIAKDGHGYLWDKEQKQMYRIEGTALVPVPGF